MDFLVYSTLVLGKAFALIAGNALMLLLLMRKMALLPTQAETWASDMTTWLHGWTGTVLMLLAILLDAWLLWHIWLRRRLPSS